MHNIKTNSDKILEVLKDIPGEQIHAKRQLPATWYYTEVL